MAAARANRALAALGTAIAKVGNAVNVAGSRNGGTPTRRPLKLTPTRRRQLKLQGQYMGLVRNLKPKHKAMLRAIREKKGYEAAIRMARGIRVTR